MPTISNAVMQHVLFVSNETAKQSGK